MNPATAIAFSFAGILTSSPEHLKPSLQGDINSLYQLYAIQLEASSQDRQDLVVQVSVALGYVTVFV